MDFAEFESFLFCSLLAWAGIALAIAVVAIGSAKRQVGRSIHAARGSRRVRFCALAFCLLSAGLLLSVDASGSVFALLALSLAILVAAIAPGSEDMLLGEEGARHGWQARNWSQLEGWRLVGSHLRFLVHGELVAVEVPPGEMERVRARIEQASPEPETQLGLGAR